MPKASPIQEKFNAGELSPKLEGRVDLDKYSSGCKTLENFIPEVQGSIVKRPGTLQVHPAKDTVSNRIRLVPFVADEDTAYVLEFGNNYIRVYKDSDIITVDKFNVSAVSAGSPTTITTSGTHTFIAGDQVVFESTGLGTLDRRELTVTAPVTATQFDVVADGTGYISGGNVAKIYEISTTYGSGNNLDWAQSVDAMYIAAQGFAPRGLQRVSDTSWALTSLANFFVEPPFQDENTTGITVYFSAASTTATITASSGIFDSNMVGGYIKIREVVGVNHDEWASGQVIGATGTTRRYNGNVYSSTNTGTTGSRAPVHTDGVESDGTVTWRYLHSGYGYAQITAFTSSTVVTGSIQGYVPASIVGSGNASEKWAFSSWDNYHGWPEKVVFFEDRLLFASNANQPQTVWGSVTGDYQNFRAGTNDDDSWQYTINARDYSKIQWMSPGKVLLLGTSSGEFVMSASTEDQAITPTNVRIVRQETRGSKPNVRIANVGPNAIFTPRAGTKVIEIGYLFDSDSYVTVDLSVLANHICFGSIKEMAFQEEPTRILWMVMDNGNLVGMTYEKTENVIAFHKHTFGGTGVQALSVAVIPHPDGDCDQVWLATTRDVSGENIEVMDKIWGVNSTLTDSFFSDCGYHYTGTLTSTITGLWHLNGLTVKVLENGVPATDKTVVNGAITLDGSSVSAAIGLNYNATMQTMRLESGAADGTAQGKTKRITNLTTRLYDTGQGLYMGPNTTTMEEIPLTSGQLFTGDTEYRPWPEGYEQEGRITLQHRNPLPCTIIAVMPQLVTQDR